MAAKIVLNKIYHQFEFARRKLIAERHHAVAAVGDMVVDLVVRFVFMLAVADVRNHAAVVERFSFALGAVTDRTILPEQGCLVRSAISYRVTDAGGRNTGADKKNKCENYNERLQRLDIRL